jgi:hypothetical protein
VATTQPINDELPNAHDALQSLGGCAVEVTPYLDRWFVTAFNEWFNQAVLKGYGQSMALVFDMALLLLEPTARIKRSRTSPYIDFIAKQREGTTLLRLAHRVIAQSPDDTRPTVVWILLESMLRQFPGAWSMQHQDPHSQRGEKDTQNRVRASGRSASAASLKLVSPSDNQQAEPDFEGWITQDKALELPERRALFAAHVACHGGNVQDKLDRELVSACLDAPNLAPAHREPPSQRRVELDVRSRSIVPGPIAGVTRIATKRAEDPISDILPSELALFQIHPMAGLAQLLFGKPLIVLHENEKDIVPQHRALACFVVDAGTLLPAERGRQFIMRAAANYAKRLALDLIRDLRDGWEIVRQTVDIELDLALYALPDSAGEAIVHQMLPIEQLPTRKFVDGHLERLELMMKLADLAPRYFDQPTVRRRITDRERRTTSRDRTDPDVGRFLQTQARRSPPYNAIHVIALGTMHSVTRLLSAANRLGGHDATRRRTIVISVNGAEVTTDLETTQLEPAWYVGEARSSFELSRALGRPKRLSVADVRKLLLARVLGQALDSSDSGNPAPAQPQSH